MDIVTVTILMIIVLIFGVALGYVFALSRSTDGYDVAEDTAEDATEPQQFTITTVTIITDEDGNIINEEETEMTFEA